MENGRWGSNLPPPAWQTVNIPPVFPLPKLCPLVVQLYNTLSSMLKWINTSLPQSAHRRRPRGKFITAAYYPSGLIAGQVTETASEQYPEVHLQQTSGRPSGEGVDLA